MLSYASFVERSGYNVKLIVPRHVPKQELVGLDFTIERKIYSRFYRLSKKGRLLNKIYDLILKLSGNYNEIIRSKIDKFRDYISVYQAYIFLRKQIKINGPGKILIPTLDSISLKLVQKLLLNSSQNNEFFLRINSIEFLNSSINEFKIVDILKSLIQDHSQQIFIGVETFKIMAELKKKFSPNTSILLSPLPFVEKKRERSQDNIYGFIGGAKRRKGFSEIPYIISLLDRKSPNSKFLVQQSPYSWLGYREVIDELKNIHNVELLPGILTNFDFFRYLSQCSFIVLPYDNESYLSGGSSLFYHASDLLIPSISYDDLPFSDEIKLFECGILLERQINLDEEDLSTANREKLEFNLLRYNKFRNDQNIKFLRI
jgi:hypothetical protein